MKVPTILEAMNHPGLFGPFFRGASWAPWRVFLAALFGLPMDGDQLALFRHHTGRSEAPAVASKEAALIVGRRGGKSRIMALIATYLATFVDYAAFLAPGEVATIAVIAADRRQARVIFRYVRGLIGEVPRLKAMVTDETAESMTLGRVVIEIATASFRVTRGYTFAAVLGDESAFWRTDDSSANPDSEIMRAIRPGLATIPGAMLLNASSPYRKAGVLYGAFKRHWGKDDARVLVWRGTSREMNCRLDEADEAEAYEEDPQSAAAEWGAEFRDDITDFVPREIVDACVMRGRFEQPRIQGVRHLAFVDPSGGTSDSMTLGIAHRAQDGKAILDCIREHRPPFSPEGVVAEMAALLKTYGVHEVTGDRYAGEWPREQFRKQGVTYKLSERTKGDIYLEFLPLLNSGRVELLDASRLVSQLCGLERRTSRSGKDSIDHGQGMHDDIANAAAGVLVMAGAGRQPMKISQEAVALARSWRGGGVPPPPVSLPWPGRQW